MYVRIEIYRKIYRYFSAFLSSCISFIFLNNVLFIELKLAIFTSFNLILIRRVSSFIFTTVTAAFVVVVFFFVSFYVSFVFKYIL